ncbi:PDZ domain-containing protein [Anaerolineae bacterium CFX9]|nr:PDZ domain-containing protein [Anaerolineae bacterium CFX9]
MTDFLKNLSDDLASTVEAAGASIVRVEGRRRQSATGVVWSADGMIITTHHVVERDDNIRVGLPNGDVTSAALVGRDPTTDLALLRVQANGLTPASWAADDEMRVGHLVVAIGRPERTLQATLGIVSALDEAWRTSAGGTIDRYVQTDVVMYPGFSGGPLVSAAGPFYGINSSALARGVSVTIPSVTLRRVTEMLLTHGRVRRGYLGVSAQPVRLPSAMAQHLEQETGLLVMSVEPDSPSDKGGLTLGDTIVGVAGARVRHMDDLMGQLGGDAVGKAVPVKVLRGGQIAELTVTIGERK